MTPTYTLANTGCYVDGARGIYAVDAIVGIAEEHGMPTPEGCEDSICRRCGPQADSQASSWAFCEHAGEIEDECDAYMGAHHGVEGCYWGRNDNGDWGLWEGEDTDNGE